MDYFIFKDKDSRNIKELIVNSLPTITKAPKRTEVIEIEGRDGDIVEDYGYQAYDKTLKITLIEDYDVNKLINWLDGKGKLILSNEPNKYYEAEIIEQIDFDRLFKYEPVEVVFHCQPYKYLLNEETKVIEMTQTEQGEEITVEDACVHSGKLDIKSGKSEQATRSEKNVLPNYRANTQTTNNLTFTNNNNGSFSLNGTASAFSQFIDTNTFKLKAGTYTLQSNNTNTSLTLQLRNEDGTTIITQTATHVTFTLSSDTIVKFRAVIGANGSFSNSTIFPLLYSGEYNSSMEYELYGVSPSPDYPSRIRNVGDNINLYDGEDLKTAEGATSFQKSLKENTDYNLSFKKSRINGVTISNQKVYSVQVIRFYNSGGELLSEIAGTVYSLPNNSIIDISIPFTTPSNTSYAIFHLGNNNGDVNINTLCSEIKLEKGLATPYTPHNCGSADFKVENKNKAYMEKYHYIRGFLNGILVSYSSYSSYIAQVKPNTKHTVSFTGADNNVSNLCCFDKNMTYLEGNAFNSGNPRKFTTPINCKYVTIAVNDAVNDFMLEEGNIKTEFIEHQEQIISFPFTEGQVLHEGDYLASNGIHQNRKTVILTGEESIAQRNNGDGSTTITFNLTSLNDVLTGVSGEKYINCNMFKYEQSSNSGNEGIGISGGTIYIQIKRDRLSTLNMAGFKSYLAQQYANGTPVIVEYELAEEIVIPYTTEQEEAYYELQHLLMYEGYTQITCIDEIKPDIILNYLSKEGATIENQGLVQAKPILKIFGNGKGTIYLNNIQLFDIEIDDEYVIVDSKEEEAYKDNILKNRFMNGPFPILQPGNNEITWSGDIEKVEVMPNSVWL